MKIFYFSILFYFILISNSLFSQSALDTANAWPQNEEGKIQEDKKVYTKVEIMPLFPGGDDSLNFYLRDHIKYPADALNNKISGKVYVSFVIDQTGKVKDTKVLRGIGGGCDEEALRVVRLMPNWIPGMQNGNPVNVQYNLPIMFSLQH